MRRRSAVSHLGRCLLGGTWLLLGCGARTPLPLGEQVAAQASQPMVALGVDHACLASGDGKLRCWGANAKGQLGDGTTVDHASPRQVTGLAEVVEIGLGHRFSCTRHGDGAVRCWGDRSDGQTGDGIPLTDFTAPRSLLVPTAVTGLEAGTGAVQLALGEAHACARFDNGRVACWGLNETGELGYGGKDSSSAPLWVSGIDDATAVGAGTSHSCALVSGGRVKCWGSALEDQLGAVTSIFCGSDPCTRLPLPVVGVEGAIGLAVGGDLSCAVFGGGIVRCWGRLVDEPDSSPVPVPGLDSVVQLAVAKTHACARKADGSVWCWGSNSFGQLGFPTSTPCPAEAKVTCALVPERVRGLDAAVQLAVGQEYTCAVTRDGRLWCWGRNSSGQLGDGTKIDRSSPTPIPL